MSTTYTTNYHLGKQTDTSDNFDMSVITDNMDIIDTQMKSNDNRIRYVSENLYNPALQTPETISPHYYFNGVPYSQTTYDTIWNCTALIPVEPNTTYSVCIIPSAENSNKPWINATHGGFCYDVDGNYISGTLFSGNTFTTTSTTKYIRFNYKITDISLNQLNQRCMLVKGSIIPTIYKPYYDYYVKDKIEEIEEELSSLTISPAINYVIDQDGNGVTLITKYSSTHDIAINLKKKGGNNLFDFYSFALIENDNKIVSQSTDGAVSFLTTTSDWFAPFIVGAVNNADGDEQSETFTGGNHQYNNQGSGSTPTARGVFLKFLADNREVTGGADGCSKFEMIWTNLVQGYNTKKADGSGREILQENHRLIFDGQKFEAFVDLIPLEDISMVRWYGIQWTWTPWSNTRYIGATNRSLYDASSADSSSGDKKTADIIAYGTSHEIRISLDSNYDLGDRKYYSGTDGIFTRSYNKGYYYIINDTTLNDNNMYSLHCFYEFTARKVVEVSNN